MKVVIEQDCECDTPSLQKFNITTEAHYYHSVHFQVEHAFGDFFYAALHLDDVIVYTSPHIEL